MTKSEKSTFKRIWGYFMNALFLLTVLILIIPSWRSSFQTWFQSMTLSEVSFTDNGSVPVPLAERNWELVSTDGELFNFAEFEGKPIVLNFWATWCTACRAELPHYAELRENWNDEIVFAAITTESLETVEQSGLADDYDFLYCTQEYQPFFEVSVFPTLAIIDKEMNMVYRMEGAADLNNEENISFLNALLEKP